MDVRSVAMAFEAVMVSMSKTKEGVTLRLAIHPNDVPADLMADFVGTRYQVALVKIGDDGMPVKGRRKEEGDRAVAVAGTLCRNERFQHWLVKRGLALYASEKDAGDAVRAQLGITSRAELATDEVARRSFFELVEEFKKESIL